MTSINADGTDGLASHAFVRGLPADQVAQLARTCRITDVPQGHRFFEEGQVANRLWLIRSGQVALDIHASIRPALLVETLGEGDMLGLSWLAGPFRWQFGAEAVAPTVAFELDGTDVRAACEAHPAFGYQFALRAMSAACSRLHSARIRMLDLYGITAETEDTR